MTNRWGQRRCLAREIPLVVLVVWGCAVCSFPHGHRQRISGSRPSSTGSSLPSRRFAFPWFGDSPEDKNDNDLFPASAAGDVPLSESISDVANIIDNFKTSKGIGERTGAALQDLSRTIVEGTAADGKVRVAFNGQQVPVGVEVDETYLEDTVSGRGKEGVDELCLALTNAMKDAYTKSGTKVEEKLKYLYSDLDFGDR
mmetsp:Transcript_28439/g.60956  ORF Transcript_28439/g.60956 Transcript_28439/m.60956 type:complete len:199 (-) Transcript_28439:809-1405(-)